MQVEFQENFGWKRKSIISARDKRARKILARDLEDMRCSAFPLNFACVFLLARPVSHRKKWSGTITYHLRTQFRPAQTIETLALFSVVLCSSQAQVNFTTLA